MVNEDLYICKRENKLTEVDRNYLIERLELENPVIGEEGESLSQSGKERTNIVIFLKNQNLIQ